MRAPLAFERGLESVRGHEYSYPDNGVKLGAREDSHKTRPSRYSRKCAPPYLGPHLGLI